MNVNVRPFVAVAAFAALLGIPAAVLAEQRSMPPPLASIFDGARGPLLYTLDNYDDLVDVYPEGTRSLKLRAQIGSPHPNAVAVDKDENVYVVDEDAPQIWEFARGKKNPLRIISSPSDFFATFSIAVGGDGSIYLLQEYNENAEAYLNQLDSSGKLVRSIPLGNDGYGSFTVDKAGKLYVSADGNIMEFLPGKTSPSATLKEPSNPGGIAIDSKNELVVGFPYINEVAIESLPSGKILRTISTVQAGDYVALDEANDYLYAVDAYGETLQWFDFRSGKQIGFKSGIYLQIAIDPGT